jgi:hypothetical protein
LSQEISPSRWVGPEDLGEKSLLFVLGFETQNVRLLASLYIDYAIPAPKDKYETSLFFVTTNRKLVITITYNPP